MKRRSYACRLKKGAYLFLPFTVRPLVTLQPSALLEFTRIGYLQSSAVLVWGVHSCVCFLSLSLSLPPFLLLKQHRKFKKERVHSAIHHPSTFLHLSYFLATRVYLKQNKKCNQTVHTVCACSLNLVL